MRFFPFLRSLLGRLALVASVAILGTSTALAQRQPLVLVHGFFSDGNSWSEAQTYFQRELPATTYAWTLGWEDRIFRQKNRLLDYMAGAGLPDTTILIAHSNGGLVARDASRSRAVKGILTIGSPHQGAPIAISVRSGAIQDLGATITYFADRAYDDYSVFPSDHFCLFDEEEGAYCDPFLPYALDAAYGMRVIGLTVAGLADAFLIQSVFNDGGALNDIQPFSSLVSDLNAAQNLSREQAQMAGRRVALAAIYTGTAAHIWAGVRPAQAATLTDVTDAIYGDLLYASFYYYNYWDYRDENSIWKQMYWQDWERAAATLYSLDYDWCVLIGGVVQGNCDLNDGIFPVAFQRWSGSGVINDNVYGPAHSDEKASGAFHSLAKFYLLNTFGVQAPPSTNPPNVYINWQFPTAPGSYTYTAVASGGNGTYSYQWQLSVDGLYFWATGDTGSQMTLYLDYNNPVYVRVIVTSGGVSSSATQYVPAISQCGFFAC